MHWLIILESVFSVIGSLTLFLFGMKLMSEALQKVTGSGMRRTISALSGNPVKGVLTGLGITSVVQFSSATVVVVVSLVNAGMLSLYESLGLIMGANIGTTVKSVIISFVGFGVNVDRLILPLIALALPFMFIRKRNYNAFGEIIIGIALLFFSLSFLRNAVPDLHHNVDLMLWMKEYTHLGIASVLLFVVTGIILTMIVQSSSAFIAFVFVLCQSGWLRFDLAAAMVIGANIGTTYTALLASLIANAAAKRAAMFHLLFNVFGAIWVLILFRPFLSVIDQIVIALQGASSFVQLSAIPLGLSLVHSGFNLFTTFILIGFVPSITRLLERIIPLKKEEKLQHTFTFIDAPIHSTSELSALQAHKEIVLFATNVQFMISSLPILLKEKDQSQYDQLFETIKKTEDLADKFEVEITNFITRLSEHELSDRTSLSVRIMQKIADDLESIADECMGLARSIDVKNQQKVWFNQDMRDDLNQMFRLLSHAFIVLLENLRKEYLKADTEKPLLIEKQINEMRDHLRLKNIDNLNKGDYMHLNGNFFNDFVFRSEKIGDLICNINDTLTGYIDDYHHL